MIPSPSTSRPLLAHSKFLATRQKSGTISLVLPALFHHTKLNREPVELWEEGGRRWEGGDRGEERGEGKGEGWYIEALMTLFKQL